MPFRSLRIALLIALFAWPFAVAYGQQRQAPPKPHVYVTSEDKWVMDAVIRDLEHDASLGRVGRSRDLKLILSLNTPAKDPHWMPEEEKPVPAPGRPDMPRVPQSLKNDLSKRHGRMVDEATKNGWPQPGWKGYRPASRRLALVDIGIDDRMRRKVLSGELWEEHPTARGVIWAWLPGYSEDGNRAVVQLQAVPGPRVLELWGYFILTKVRGKWRVTDRFLEPPIL